MLQCRYIYVKLSCFSYLFKFSTALYCEQHSCIFFFFLIQFIQIFTKLKCVSVQGKKVFFVPIGTTMAI